MSILRQRHELQRRKREWKEKECLKKSIRELFFASEYQDINDDGSLKIVICSSQDYNGPMAKHESIQGILKYNKVKLQWWEWDNLSHLISDHCIDDASLHITLSLDVLKLRFLDRSDLERFGLQHQYFNVLPYGDMKKK
tara:strand:+ start:1295 stop:1711 length:417 start_codon:yes stop_codon:yes gene_type:complete